MDAVKSAQALVHMTDEGSMQLPQPAMSEMDEPVKWISDRQAITVEESAKRYVGEDSVEQPQQLLRQVTVFAGDDAGKATAAMMKQTEIVQKNLVSAPENVENVAGAVRQAEAFAMTAPDVQQLLQTETAMHVAMGNLQLQEEQRQVLMQQVQNNTAGQSRNVQVTNHLNPNISITFGDVRESADVDEVARRLRLCLLEEMQRCGEGVW